MSNTNQSLTSYQEVEHNFFKLMDLSTSPYDFCQMFISYLTEVGWTEDQFEDEFHKVQHQDVKQLSLN